MTTLLTRVRSIPRELELFALAIFMSGIAYSLFDSAL